MIRVSVLYPNDADKKFDHDYYANQHVGLVKERLGAALLRAEVDRGIGSAEPGAPAPFAAVGHLFFDSLEDFQQAFGPHSEEIMGDIPNFTDIAPQILISETDQV